jgi:hypothetical protein
MAMAAGVLMVLVRNFSLRLVLSLVCLRNALCLMELDWIIRSLNSFVVRPAMVGLTFVKILNVGITI